MKDHTMWHTCTGGEGAMNPRMCADCSGPPLPVPALMAQKRIESTRARLQKQLNCVHRNKKEHNFMNALW